MRRSEEQGGRELVYTVLTPARDEEDNLRRLARCLAQQSVRPARWLIVINGGRDGSLAVARSLAATHGWVDVAVAEGTKYPTRGGHIARIVNDHIGSLAATSDVVVKVDADVSIPSDYFAHLLEAFQRNPRLGLASGVRYERENGSWRQRHVTNGAVAGPCRAYRVACLEDVLPLEEEFGWDGIDECKAQLRGWTTMTVRDAAFHHHRLTGQRDGSRFKAWVRQGQASHFMAYRPLYLTARVIYHLTRERAAMGMLLGYLQSALTRAPQCHDDAVRAMVRSRQTLPKLPARIREKRGQTSRR